MINAAYVLWELKHGQRGVASSHPYRNYKFKSRNSKVENSEGAAP
jgi:hypothetical protein